MPLVRHFRLGICFTHSQEWGTSRETSFVRIHAHHEYLEWKLLNLEGMASIFGVTVSSEIPHFFVSKTRHPSGMLGAFFSIFPTTQKENRCKERRQLPWTGSSLASGHAFL